VFTEQLLYCLSHASSTFCSSYFEGGVSQIILLWLALKHDPPGLSFLSSWDYRCELLAPN
jgi:hypothetical protein